MSIEKAKEFIQKKYDPNFNGEGYWSYQNIDESYEVGREVGFNEALYKLGTLLGMDLPEIKSIQ